MSRHILHICMLLGIVASAGSIVDSGRALRQGCPPCPLCQRATQSVKEVRHRTESGELSTSVGTIFRCETCDYEVMRTVVRGR